MINLLFRILLSLLLMVTVSSYSLEGAWNLRVTPGIYQHLYRDVTFQFTTSSLNNQIQRQLFVYNCFLSQFSYYVREEELTVRFKQSRLLEQECQIEQIEELRHLLTRIDYFNIRSDELILMDLAGRQIFTLKKQKIPYRELLINSWTLSDVNNSQAAIDINQTTISLCQGQYTLGYTLKLINESYPLLSVQAIKKEQCQDWSFGESWKDAVFVQVMSNRSQLLVYNFQGKRLFRMDQGISRQLMMRYKRNQSKADQQHKNTTVSGQNSISQIDTTQSSASVSSTSSSTETFPSASSQATNTFLDISLSQFANGFSFVPSSNNAQETSSPFGSSSGLYPNTQSFEFIPTISTYLPSPTQNQQLPATVQERPPSLSTQISLPLSEFIHKNKWLISSMTGYRFVPPLLKPSTIVFTSNRIVLYCPCNTYYTTYRLDGNYLRETAWTGTQNQCSGSLDDLLTNLVFYSKVIKQEGNKLVFFFDQKLRMVEFEPFTNV